MEYVQIWRESQQQTSPFTVSVCAGIPPSAARRLISERCLIVSRESISCLYRFIGVQVFLGSLPFAHLAATLETARVPHWLACLQAACRLDSFADCPGFAETAELSTEAAPAGVLPCFNQGRPAENEDFGPEPPVPGRMHSVSALCAIGKIPDRSQGSGTAASRCSFEGRPFSGGWRGSPSASGACRSACAAPRGRRSSIQAAPPFAGQSSASR